LSNSLLSLLASMWVLKTSDSIKAQVENNIDALNQCSQFIVPQATRSNKWSMFWGSALYIGPCQRIMLWSGKLTDEH